MINKKLATLIFSILIISMACGEESYFSKVTMVFTGDVMLHESFLKMYHGKKGFDFNPIFKDIKRELKGDIVCGNLETTIPGKLYNEYSGYPTFRSPSEILTALKNAGFTHLNFCNNHVFDSMPKGFLNTVKAIKKHNLKIIGNKESPNDSGARIWKVKGFKFGVISYTYDTNFPIKNKTKYINIIGRDNMKRNLTLLRERHVDFIFVILHFGREYEVKPDKEQVDLANFLFKNGANFIVGMHPHTVQPYYFNGNYVKPRFVVFSLGNFISAQTRKHTNVGEMLVLKFEKDPGSAQLVSYKIIYITKKKKNGLYEIITTGMPKFIQNKIEYLK